MMRTALLFFSLLLSLAAASANPAETTEALDIGSRLGLFVDDYLIDLREGVRLQLHEPQPEEVVLVADAPWEGNISGYFNVFRDGELYRMYYRGAHAPTPTTRGKYSVACHAESRDGIHWIKPEVGLFEAEGSKANNIIWNGDWRISSFVAFKDSNPDSAQDARYKAFARHGPISDVLYALKSPDGIHWSLMSRDPVITKGAFDSQNLGFWDTVRSRYVAFTRMGRKGVRDIQFQTSQDFLNWTDPVFLEYPGAPEEHLYTNAILPYERAPHLLLGFPTRFLPETQQTEPILMASRDGGRSFHRWPEAVIPRSAPRDRDGNRSNYMVWGLVQLPSRDHEYSVYAKEAYYRGPAVRIRRFTYRVDGFVSVHAGYFGGELVTKPLVFNGDNLVLNISTSAAGSIRLEIQDAKGNPLPGFALEESPLIWGDEIEHTVRWKRTHAKATSDKPLARIAGKPVRLRFVMKDADLYSLRFR